MTAILSPTAKQQFLDNAGNPAAGFRLFVYRANTTTPEATYTNRAGTVPNTNPIILDARGECVIYLTPGVVYDYVLKTDQDVLIWTREDVIADAGDANAVAYDDPVAPAYLKTLSDMHNAEPVSVLRAIPKNLWGGIQDGTNTTHLSAYLNDLFAGVNTHKRGELTLPDGTYLLDEPLIYLPKTTFRGAGFGRSTLKVDPLAFPTVGGIYQIMRNSNYDTASSLEDGFVVVDGLAFDYNGLGGVVGGGSHALTGRYLRYVRVLNCWFKGGENATAWLACDDIVTQNCTSIDPENAGFDHWDGFSVAKVIGCTVRRQGSANTKQGIQFTADPSTGSGRTSSQVVCIGNFVTGLNFPSASAIIVNALNASNSVNNAVVEGNIVTDSSVAVVLEGSVNNATVKGNVVSGGGQAVLVKSSPAGNPDCVGIIGNVMRNPNVSPSDIAAISTAGTNVSIIGNTISGSSFPYAIWQQASGVIANNSFATGSSGRILDGSGGVALILDTDTANQRFDFNKSLRAPGILFGSDTAESNKLDKYAENTWTPVLQFGGASTGITYAANGQQGTYTRIGNRIFFHGRIVLTSKGSATGIAGITGLSGLGTPTGVTSQPCNVHFYNGLNGSINFFAGYIAGSGTLLFRASNGTGSMPSDATDTSFTNTTELNFSGSFTV